MALDLNAVASTDSYGGNDYRGDWGSGYVAAASADIFCRIAWGVNGAVTDKIEDKRLFANQTFNFTAPPGKDILEVAFRSAAAGVPATVSGYFSERISLGILTTIGGAGTISSSSAVPTLANFAAALGADVAIPAANTFVDGPTLALPAGTWLIVGGVVVSYGGANLVVAKLWDGATVFSSAEFHRSGNTAGPVASLAVRAIVKPVVATTYRIAAACDVGGQTIKAATPDEASGNNASSLVAIQLG